jgi:hypothetical protein
LKNIMFGGWLLAGLMSILLTGCGQTEVLDSGYDIDEFGIVNDSMAILSVSYWDHVKNGATLMSSSDDYYETTGFGLLVVDMRQQKIYSEKSLNSDLGVPMVDQIFDSLMIFWDYTFNSEEGYKIVKAAYLNVFKQEEQNLLDWDSTSDNTDYLTLWEGQSFDYFIFSIHDWGSGLTGVNKGFFVLDFKKNTMRKWTPSGASLWLGKCADIQWTSASLRCLNVSDIENKLEVLNEDEKVLDSLVSDGLSNVRFFGNYIGVGDKLFRLDTSGHVHKTPVYNINSRTFVIKFQDSTGDTTSYSGGTKE